MAGKIIVGCSLPNGVIIHHPDNKDVKVRLNGVYQSPIHQQPNRVSSTGFSTTEVDADFWAAWKAKHEKTYGPYVNGVIWEAKTQSDAMVVAREREKVLTGFEAMGQSTAGVKTADK